MHIEETNCYVSPKELWTGKKVLQEEWEAQVHAQTRPLPCMHFVIVKNIYSYLLQASWKTKAMMLWSRWYYITSNEKLLRNRLHMPRKSYSMQRTLTSLRRSLETGLEEDRKKLVHLRQKIQDTEKEFGVMGLACLRHLLKNPYITKGWMHGLSKFVYNINCASTSLSLTSLRELPGDRGMVCVKFVAQITC